MNILICCAGGMSSSLLVQKMRDEVKQRHLENIKIGACAQDQLHRYISQTDVLLLAPQISFLSNDLQKLTDGHQIKTFNINSQDYGLLNASKILDMILLPSTPNTQTIEVSNTLKKATSMMTPIASKVAFNRFLSSISKAFTSIMPVTIIGAIFTLLNHLPYEFYQNILVEYHLNELLSLGTDTSMNLISVYFVFFLSYHYVRTYDIHGHPAGLLAMICFFMITGKTNGTYSTTYLGTNGLITAIFVGLFVGWLYIKIYQADIVIHLPKNVPKQVKRSFEALIPTVFILTFFMFIAYAFHQSSYGNVQQFVYTKISLSLNKYLSNNIFSYVFFQLIVNILWFSGIHGGNVVNSITNPIYIPLALENFQLFQNGQVPIHIISNVFAKCFTSGGVGSMFSLSILMTFFAKSERFKTLGKISLPTTFFYINEPLLFGIPIILNVKFFIPLMSVTPILSSITYLMMKTGLLPIPIGIQLPWTTPPIIYGFLQGGWKLALWEIVMIIAAALIWFPFFKKADQEAYQEENNPCHN